MPIFISAHVAARLREVGWGPVVDSPDIVVLPSTPPVTVEVYPETPERMERAARP